MYPSANIVVFVNLEDIFAEVAQKLENHSLYLCVSYDTYLLAMEPITGYVNNIIRKCWNRYLTASIWKNRGRQCRNISHITRLSKKYAKTGARIYSDLFSFSER